MPELTCQRPGCGRPMPSRKRRDARWCSRSCESKARRQAARRAAFEAASPGAAELLRAEGQSVAELRDVADDEQDGLDDETGLYSGESAPDPWQARNAAFHEQMRLTDAIDAIEARYERLLAPHRETMRRNIGVKPPAMARLEAARDAEIRELIRKHEQARALGNAVRMAPQRAVQATERQQEQAALSAFARALPGGSRRYEVPQWSGRATDDIAAWRR